MSVTTIPHASWDDFCERLAAARREEDVTVELTAGGCHALLLHRRLLAIRVVDATTGVRFEVETHPVVIGKDRSVFALTAPTSVVFEQLEERGPATLTASGSEGATLTVRFSAPQRGEAARE